MEFDNLHQILRSLYEQMMPLCEDMAGVAKGIAGLGALFYVAYRVWQSLARAEPIDVFPMLRPFAIGLCIMFFPTVVLGTINSILSPVVQGTAKMLEAETLDMNTYRQQKDKLEYEAMTGELMTAKTIFRNEDGHLFRHLRYTYTYDSENRVTSKEAFKWDSVKEAWVPYFKLDVEYTDSEVELNYARWNSRTNGYDSYTQTTVYELNDSNAALMLASTK